MIGDIISFRHHLHAHPELSGHERNTHDAIAAFLRKLYPTVLHEHVGGYGLVAVFGDAGAEAVAFRADIDALPICETLPLPYASESPGVSHKCGHDGHTAILLRLAEKLSERMGSGSLPCTAVLVFQPAEETGEGSRRILESGVLQKYRISAVYGLHNLPGYPLGQLVFRHGTFAAASVGVVLHLQGRETHAAFPEMGVNPGLAVAEIIRSVLALNTSPDFDGDGFRQATLIAVRLGKEAFGTSAGEAYVMFTLRAYTNRSMAALKEEVPALVRSIADRYGLGFNMEWREPFNATENHDSQVDKLVEKARNAGSDFVMAEHPFRWSEDFADYLMRYPGAFFGIGSGEGQPELHHPDFDFPDAVIPLAADFFEKLLLPY